MAEARRLAELVPAIQIHRDAVLGAGGEDEPGPLQSLLRLLDDDIAHVRVDLARLYNNWFIETAEPWALPHIGELLGLETQPGSKLTRAHVANTIRNRRRKGTAALLEELALDIGGWPAALVESNPLLLRLTDATAPWQPVTTLPAAGASDVVDRIGGPFDRAARMPNVAGPYAPRSATLHLWRVPTVSIESSPAGRQEEVNDRSFTVTMLGHPIGLVARPVPETRITEVAGWSNVPSRITRGDLRRDLAASGPQLYGPGRSIHLVIDGVPVEAARIDVVDLSRWGHRPESGRVGFDPETGRLVTAPGRRVEAMTVSFSAAVDDLGGTAHPRPLDVPMGGFDRHPDRDPAAMQQAAVARYRVQPERADRYPTIDAALARWAEDRSALAHLAPSRVRIEVAGNQVYDAPDSIEVPADTRLEIVGIGGAPLLWRADLSPVRDDSIVVTGGGTRSCLVLQDVVVAGRALTIEGDLDGIVLRHSTLVPGWNLLDDCRPARPGEPSLLIADGLPCLRLERSISGPIDVAVASAHGAPIAITATDSIVDAGDDGNEAVSCRSGGMAHAAVGLSGALIIGRVLTHEVTEISDAIITGELWTARRRRGCLRFSCVPPGGRPPTHYETLFDCVPRFVSRRYGREGYGRLSLCADPRLRRGAADGGEMGAFGWLDEPNRLDELERLLAEYSPAGVRVGLSFADLEEL